jgi:hypothetical protein
MARKPKQKLLTQLPAKFDPDFMERLSRRYSLTRVVQARREALEAHCGGDLSYIQRSLVKRTVWLELLTESYEQKVASGESVDVGALTQLNNTLKGLYKDLGLKPMARPIRTLRDIMSEAPPDEPEPADEPPSDDGDANAPPESSPAPKASNAATEGAA